MQDTTTDIYQYCDYVSWGFGPGAEVSIKTDKMEEVVSIYKRSFRSLTKIGMKSEVSGSYGALSGSLAVTAEHEQELQESLESTITSTTQTHIENSFKMAEGQDYGTVIWKVDMQIGGVLVTIPINQETNYWDNSNIAQFQSHYASGPMQSMLERCGGEISELPKTITPKLIMPFSGKTCHHVKFLRPFSDSCHVDNANCVELDGTEFVVCHHNDFEWIGGTDCNCHKIEAGLVVRRPASELSVHYQSAIAAGAGSA